jgi:Zn-dependent alcohol dehydrogenase
MAREWEIIGTNSQIHSFPDAINILASGDFPTSTFVSHQMPLKDINRAIEMNLKAETLKTIIDTT